MILAVSFVSLSFCHFLCFWRVDTINIYKIQYKHIEDDVSFSFNFRLLVNFSFMIFFKHCKPTVSHGRLLVTIIFMEIKKKYSWLVNENYDVNSKYTGFFFNYYYDYFLWFNTMHRLMHTWQKNCCTIFIKLIP